MMEGDEREDTLSMREAGLFTKTPGSFEQATCSFTSIKKFFLTFPLEPWTGLLWGSRSTMAVDYL